MNTWGPDGYPDLLTSRAPSKPGDGYSIAPGPEGTIIVESRPMNIAMAACLHRDLGELIEGKIVRTAEGWQYTS